MSRVAAVGDHNSSCRFDFRFVRAQTTERARRVLVHAQRTQGSGSNIEASVSFSTIAFLFLLCSRSCVLSHAGETLRGSTPKEVRQRT
jgi:hypothetical protein